MKDFAGTEIDVGHGVIPSISTAVDSSCALEVRQRQQESCPPSQPDSQSKDRVSNPHEGLSRAAPATEEPARPHIPEPYDAQAGGGKLIPVHGEGDILVLIVGRC